MRCLLLVAILTGVLSAQSMVEFGAVAAGSAVGGVAGKKVSESITTTFTRTGGILNKATQTSASPKIVKIPQATTSSVSSSRLPTLQVSPGVPKPSRSSRVPVAEPNNVPPPPPAPERRSAKASASRAARVQVALVEPPPVVHLPRNVNLEAIQQGMLRSEVLALGEPSARITMFEDGQLVEVYNYRNETLPSGAVRLTGGTVVTVQVYP